MNVLCLQNTFKKYPKGIDTIDEQTVTKIRDNILGYNTTSRYASYAIMVLMHIFYIK